MEKGKRPNLRLIPGGGKGSSPGDNAGSSDYDPTIIYGSRSDPPAETRYARGVIPFPRDYPEHERAIGELSLRHISLESLQEAERELFKAVCEALATKYEKYGIKSDDFSLITYERGDHLVLVVMYTAPEALKLGDPDKDEDPDRSSVGIMRSDHTVVINDQAYDTFGGMTLEAYQAFIAESRQPDHQMPNDDIDNPVLLPGEEQEEEQVPIAWVEGNLVCSDTTDKNNYHVRVRFAVEIPQLSRTLPDLDAS